MSTITFKEFLTLTLENDQINKMVSDTQAQLSQIDSTINQRTQSLLAQKTQLQRKFSQLLKQKQAADNADQQKNKQNQQQQNQQQKNQQQQQQQNQQQQNQQGNIGMMAPGNNATGQQRI
jgi:hypothetical protein